MLQCICLELQYKIFKIYNRMVLDNSHFKSNGLPKNHIIGIIFVELYSHNKKDILTYCPRI